MTFEARHMMRTFLRFSVGHGFAGSVAATLIAMTLFFFPEHSLSNQLYGTFTSELYSWQQGDKDHLRPYESLRATFVTGTGRQARQLSFHTNLRWTTDLADKFSSDPNIFIYDSYMQIRGVPKHLETRLGRQFVYSEVGSAMLDGVRARYTPSRKVRAELFGGSSVSRLDPERVRPYSDFSVWGGRLSYLLKPELRMGIGWIRQENDGAVSRHAAGVQGEYFARTWTGFGRVSYNVLNRRLSEILARLSTSPTNWYLSGEFNWREPSVPGNSLFSIVDFTGYRILRLEANRKLRRGVSITSRVIMSFPEDDQNISTSVGISSRTLSIGYRHQSGFGGNNDGLYSSVNLSVHRQWDVYANADLNRYRVQAEQLDRSDAYGIRLGVQTQAIKKLSMRFEGQYIRNAVDDSDLRLYIRISHNFSYKSNTGKSTP